MSGIVTLTNGTQVPSSCAFSVIKAFSVLKTNPKLTYELMKRCQNSTYQWTSSYTRVHLSNFGLLQQNDKINEDIQKVLLCSLKCISNSTIPNLTNPNTINIVDPLTGSDVGTVHLYV